MGKIKASSNKANAYLRDLMRQHKIQQWRVAEALGIDEYRFSRLLRREVDQNDREIIFAAIDKLKKEVTHEK